MTKDQTTPTPINAKIWVSEKNLKAKTDKKNLLSPGVKKSILSWFDGPQEYNSGLLLLMKISPKHILLMKLMHGETKRTRNKLIHELSDSVKLLIIPKPQ
jgi:hypothetical protein